MKYATESVTVTIQNRLVLLKKALPSLLAIADAAAAATALRWSRCQMWPCENISESKTEVTAGQGV